MSLAQFQITKGCATLLLPNDFGGDYAWQIREILLDALHQQQQINAVVFDCTNLELIDQRDLDQLLEMTNCIQLMGKKVGFCSIRASLAAVMVNLSFDLHQCFFGLNLDDAINKLVDQ